MTTAYDIDLRPILTGRLTDASPDLLRSLLSTFIDALMGARGRHPVRRPLRRTLFSDRTNSRNGCRHRDFAPPSSSCRAVPPPAPALSTSPSPSRLRLALPGLVAAAQQACRAGADSVVAKDLDAQ